MGGEAMVAVVDVWLLDWAGRSFIDGLPIASDVG
jgi:hypothetical protein